MALINSVLGSAADEEEEDNGGGDLVDLWFVRPRKTFARPLGRDGSGDGVSSPDCGDMCTSEGRSYRYPGSARIGAGQP